MSEQVEEIIDIEEDRLKYRVDYIRENLIQLSDKLREKIPQGLTDEDLTKDDTFKNWVVVNSIYDASMKDKTSDCFNRMLYFLHRYLRNLYRLFHNLYNAP